MIVLDRLANSYVLVTISPAIYAASGCTAALVPSGTSSIEVGIHPAVIDYNSRVAYDLNTGHRIIHRTVQYCIDLIPLAQVTKNPIQRLLSEIAETLCIDCS